MPAEVRSQSGLPEDVMWVRLALRTRASGRAKRSSVAAPKSKPALPQLRRNPMSDKPTIVLLIEDDPADARLILEALSAEIDSPFRVEWVTLLSAGLERLSKEGVDVVMLDLSLPDVQGIEAVDQVCLAAPDLLILVLSGLTDEEVARQAVQRGAYDYFSKGHVDAHWLPRALRYVIARKTALDALAVSEARFRAISDASPLGILVTDRQGSCLYTNAAYHRISGLSFEEALGMNWKVAIHSDDRERVFAEWQDAAQNQTPFQTEFRFLREDQSVVWTRVNAAPMRQGKRLYGYVQTVEDVTERKSEEALLQDAQERLFEEKERAQVTLNSIGDGVLTTDTRGNITYLNRVAEEMTGWPWQDASGRPLAEVFSVIDGTTRQPAPNLAEQAVQQDEIVSLDMHGVLSPARRVRGRDRRFGRPYPRSARPGRWCGVGFPRCQRLASTALKDVPPGTARLSHRPAKPAVAN